MIGIARGLASLLLTAELMVLGTWGAHAETEVDLALVLAVDVSLSMEMDEQELQRKDSSRRSAHPRCTRPSARACWGASR
jgi:hypothetical protein